MNPVWWKAISMVGTSLCRVPDVNNKILQFPSLVVKRPGRQQDALHTDGFDFEE